MKLKALIISIGILLIQAIPTFAHPLLPQEVTDYIQQNPNATNEEVDAFFEENYGSVEDYYGIPKEQQDWTLKQLYLPTNEMIEDIIMQSQKGSPDIQNAKLLLSVKQGELSLWENLKAFVILGIDHILAGLDHILFVIALILILPPWKKILWMITTFTIAHSITLILAGSKVLSLSSHVVEPIIALSIAYVALTSVFSKKNSFLREFHNKLFTIFVFGLFHGLGFAGVFKEIEIPTSKLIPSLLFFNVGVELGQIIILAVSLPLIYWLNKNKHTKAIQAITILISGLALFWMVERVVG